MRLPQAVLIPRQENPLPRVATQRPSTHSQSFKLALLHQLWLVTALVYSNQTKCVARLQFNFGSNAALPPFHFSLRECNSIPHSILNYVGALLRLKRQGKARAPRTLRLNQQLPQAIYEGAGYLRILTFTSLFPNSVDPSHGIFIYQRSVHLARRFGHEVVVISPVPYFPRWLKVNRWKVSTELPSQEDVKGLRVYHPRYFLLPKVFMPFHAFSMFLGSLLVAWRVHREKRVDCIDAHFVHPDGLAGVLLGKALKIPVVVSARGTDVNLFPTFKLIRPMIKWTLRKAECVIAVSNSLKESITALGIAAAKIRVIPNGVDAQRFHRMPSIEARQQLGLPAQISILVSVGALVAAKDHSLLIRAVGRLKDKIPSLQAWILGEGPLRGSLEKLIRQLSLQDRVHLPGKMSNEELVRWFNAANLSCLTSQREGWPNVVTESLACGTPVVATRVGGLPEILHSPELGILVEQSLDSVAAGIETALAREWNRDWISQNTRERTWEQVAAEVEEVLVAAIRSTHTRHAN